MPDVQQTILGESFGVGDVLWLAAEWDGRYLTNDGQAVKAEDAFLLASALERSLDDIPDANPRIDWSPQSWREDDLPEWLSPEEQQMIEDELQNGLLDI